MSSKGMVVNTLSSGHLAEVLNRQFSRRTAIRRAGSAALLAMVADLGSIGSGSSVAASPRGSFMAQATPSPVSGTPTVVLVHGAFADGSSWSGVIEKLQAAGVSVTAPANPLRGIFADSAYTASVFAQTPGPVIAVGHSYGGAVISNAATNAANVVGLVYVAAFSPDEGEKLQDVTAKSKDAILGTALVQLKYPTGQGSATEIEFGVNPDLFHEVFAADLSASQAAVMAATQRPVSALAFGEPSGAPAWKKLPSWAVVATEDRAAGTDIVRSMAERAGATITDVAGSHVIMVSQPQAVTDVIQSALAAVS
jgi:pimeloyl-ACP methyl ester carboxylesterase